MTAAAQARTFADPVHESQRVFRAVMQAMARPGTVHALANLPPAPPPLSPAAHAVLLTLSDHETGVWLDAALTATAGIAQHLRFHTGARIVSTCREAAFAVVSEPRLCPRLDDLAIGTLEYPDRSTTVILQVGELATGRGWRLSGPGIDGEARLHVAPLPGHLAGLLAVSRTLFPRGVDVILTADSTLAALPRSTKAET